MTVRLGLAGRVALATVAAVSIGLVAGGAVFLGEIEAEGREQLDESLGARGQEILAPVFKPGMDEKAIRAVKEQRAEIPADKSAPLLEGSGIFTRVVIDGQVVKSAGDRIPADFPLPQDTGLETIAGWRTLTIADPAQPGTFTQLAADMGPVTARVARIRSLLIWLGLLVLAAGALLGWAFGALALAPLRRLRAAATGVAGTEDLHERLPEDAGPSEVIALSRSLNEMLERLERSSAETERALHATRRFAADVGHEVRTPLQAIRVNVDALRRNPAMSVDERAQVLADVGAAQDRLLALLDALQRLARGDGAQDPPEPVALADLVDARVQAAARRHPGREVHFADGAPAAVVRGWPDGLQTIVDNLIENALLHGGPAARVDLGLAAENGIVRLTVDDDGPGIPPALRERIFRRFARGPTPGGAGSGLGLALVAQQAAAHGGSVDVGDAPAGGARFTLTLPRTKS